MFIIAFFLIGEMCHTTGFIDIPTVTQYDIPGMFGGGIMFSMPFSTEDPIPSDLVDPDPKDFTLTLRYGFGGRGEIALSMYTPSAFALAVSYLLKEERGNTPALFCGIDNITYNPHISTIGIKDTVGFVEEKNYDRFNHRPPELLSAYIAMQKSLGQYLNLVIGLGRGRFVGYGPRSHIFNTDLFVMGEDYTDSTKSISGWAFGIFFGGSIRFPFGLELIAEIDGRDGNAGIKYHHKYFTTTFAITKAEHFWSPKPFSPRFTIGLETNNRFMLEGPKVGAIECIVRDHTSKQLLPNSIVDIKEINKRYKAKGGTFMVSLPVGNYTLTVIKPNYVDYIAKILVKPGVKSKLIFNLKKTEEALRYEVALRQKQTNIKKYFDQGKVYYTQGKLNEAKSSFNMVLSLNPDHQQAKEYLVIIEPRRAELISVYTSEARSRTRAKDLAKAIEYWQKVFDLDPNNTDAKAGIASLQKQIAAAKKPTKPKKPAKPKEPVITKAQIQALYKNGVSNFTAEKYSEALKIFKQIIAYDPNHKGAKDYKKRTEARIRVLKGGG